MTQQNAGLSQLLCPSSTSLRMAYIYIERGEATYLVWLYKPDGSQSPRLNLTCPQDI